jgi:hypothetical protein
MVAACLGEDLPSLRRSGQRAGELELSRASGLARASGQYDGLRRQRRQHGMPAPAASACSSVASPGELPASSNGGFNYRPGHSALIQNLVSIVFRHQLASASADRCVTKGSCDKPVCEVSFVADEDRE